jgi:hypothetical protein
MCPLGSAEHMAGANTTPLRADDVPKKSVVNEVSGACSLCVSNMRQGKNVQYGLGKGLKKCLHLYCRGVEFDVIHVGRHGTVDRGLIVYKH